MIDADRGNNTFPLHSNRAVYGSEFATQAYSIISDANSTVHRINDDSTDDSIDNSTNDSTDDLSTDDTYYYYIMAQVMMILAMTTHLRETAYRFQ